MTADTPYSYRASVKSDVSDELINTYVVRPIAGLIVFALYRTPVIPNQVTLAGVVVGLVSAVMYGFDTPSATVAAGILLWMKDVLDSADGQLARAKGMHSRAGRFLDSIGDFAVNLAVFAMITLVLLSRTGSPGVLLLGIAGFLGISLRISYHVLYQVSFLHQENAYALNRTNEELREEDRRGDPFTVRLQSLYQILYGWQDRLMACLDRWCRRTVPSKEEIIHQWYRDQIGLRISGFLGMGTEVCVLVIFSVMDRLELYLFFNAIVQNGLWLAAIAYRRLILAPRLHRMGA
jgi:phosphatidylglycerophosphate synthase